MENSPAGMSRSSVASEMPASIARPTIDFAKRPIPETAVFFKYPTRIGKVLAGHSNLIAGEKFMTWKGLLVNGLTILAITLILGGILYSTLRLSEWYYTVLEFGIPAIVFLISFIWIKRPKISNLYVGTEGFAAFERKGKTEDLALAQEVRWDEVTDLYIWSKDDEFQGNYQGTNHKYYWYERNKGEILHVMTQYQRKFQTGSLTPPRLMFMQVCAMQWTESLMKRLEHNIQTQGYASFYLLSHMGDAWRPYIQLNHESITFFWDGETSVYRFEDIARIYWEGENLRIQHKNFEKVLLLFRKGNENEIPMESLCNRNYFIQALGKMLNAPPNHPVFRKQR